jgi:4,5-dihydroxyphthalate decarboxylase
MPAEKLKIFPPVGFEANRKGIERAIQYAVEQKIIPRKLSYDELFDDVTGDLN